MPWVRTKLDDQRIDRDLLRAARPGRAADAGSARRQSGGVRRADAAVPESAGDDFGTLGGRRDLAEDLAQEVFLRVYRARKRYVPGSKFSTWLFTIANNVASNSLRSQSRRKEVNWKAPAGESTGANTLDQMAQAASSLMPSRQADKSEMRSIVREAINTLERAAADGGAAE